MEQVITKLVADVMGNRGGARLIIGGRRCSVSSVRRYTEYNNLTSSARYREDIEAEVAKAKARGDKLVWINLSSTCLFGDRGAAARDAALWDGVPRVSVGDLIEFDGEVFTIHPDHNDNFRLVKAN